MTRVTALLILCAGALYAFQNQSAITEYPVPTANSEPESIELGPDGALWFTETRQQDRPYYDAGRVASMRAIGVYRFVHR